jgi:hypothetical protein
MDIATVRTLFAQSWSVTTRPSLKKLDLFKSGANWRAAWFVYGVLSLLGSVFILLFPVPGAKPLGVPSLIAGLLLGLLGSVVYLYSVNFVAERFYRRVISVTQLSYLLVASALVADLILLLSQHIVWLSALVSVTVLPYSIYLQVLAIKSGCGYTRTAPAVWTFLFSVLVVVGLVLLPGLYLIQRLTS